MTHKDVSLNIGDDERSSIPSNVLITNVIVPFKSGYDEKNPETEYDNSMPLLRKSHSWKRMIANREHILSQSVTQTLMSERMLPPSPLSITDIHGEGQGKVEEECVSLEECR
eukprot:CAMPEP_0184655626 /NCGR_PEP_ID=MMETSP0308-20130426/14072_1 /TAXON_ID=38269 /ORGANISM="Gloeochaete witrockiana, Strain SAG 46.84" /LENGTH=111 /DNA_ID=CAMNT_0027092243 /DNA_START=94 /DNA_END=429 /DNA_ORIENTATION=+